MAKKYKQDRSFIRLAWKEDNGDTCAMCGKEYKCFNNSTGEGDFICKLPDELQDVLRLFHSLHGGERNHVEISETVHDECYKILRYAVRNLAEELDEGNKAVKEYFKTLGSRE